MKQHALFSFTGTKYRLIDFLKENIKFNPEKQQWYEPFCGSCVVGLNFAPKIAFFNDINSHLIAFYNFIKWAYSDGFDFKKVFEEWYISKLKEGHSEFYYEVRDRFNKTWRELGMVSNNLKDYDNAPEDWKMKFVMDFFFLCQSSFSHQLRYNRKGEINMAYSKFE